MNFQAAWFSSSILIAAWLLLSTLLLAYARPAWRSMQKHHSAFILSALILTTAWCLNAMTDEGQLAQMSYHLLAMNLVALMIGAPAALWLGSALLLPYLLLFNGGDRSAYPVNALALLLPPLIVNQLSCRLVNRLPANIFIFIFVNGFIASAVGMMLTGLVLVSVLDISHAFPTSVLWTTAFPIFILIAWAEAFLSGITTAIFIALRPQWINTFDDNRYLKSSNKIW